MANALLAYQHYQQMCDSDRWRALAAAGARPQRPLWCFDLDQEPGVPDVIYVAEQVTPGVVNTMPEST